MVDLGSAQIATLKGVDPQEILTGSRLIVGESPHVEKKLISREIKKEWYGVFPTQHFLTIGGTRGGKGTGFIIPNLLIYSGSCLVIDPKGENAWITAEARRKKGQSVFILDPWGEVNKRYGEAAGELETVAGFNPLSILDPLSPHYADDVAYLADALIINQGNDPHWSDSARELVAGVIAFLVEKYGQAATLGEARLLITSGADAISKVAKAAAGFGADSLANRKLARFAETNKENSSIISTALTQTAFLDSVELEKSLSRSDFSFNALVEGRATIYLVLPVDKLMTYGRWLRLMISIAIRTVARNTRPLGLPVLFMLDEFGTIGKLSAIAQAFGLMAGLQMCVWAFLQDLNQLKRDYPDDWETFIANAQEIMLFSLQDQTTCKYFSDMCGTTTLSQISIKSQEQQKKGGHGLVTDQHFARQLIMPEEFRRLQKGVLIGRHNPVFFEILFYFEQEELLKMSRGNPYFPKQKRIIEALQFGAAEKEKKHLLDSDVFFLLQKKGYTIFTEKKGWWIFKEKIYHISKDGEKLGVFRIGEFLAFGEKVLAEDFEERAAG